MRGLLTGVAAVLAFLTFGVVLTGGLFRSRVTWQHGGFDVVTVKVSRGTNHTLFLGSQVEGQVRSGLRHFGMPVNGLATHGSPTPADMYAFMVRYRGDFPDRELTSPRAELADQEGATIPLRWASGGYSPKEKTYLSVWFLDPASVPDGKVALRMKLKRSDTKLAEIAVGKLKK